MIYEVYNNTIQDMYGPGIWFIAYGQAYTKDEAKHFYIHHNTFYGCGTHPTYDWVCGIETSGFYDTLIKPMFLMGIITQQWRSKLL